MYDRDVSRFNKMCICWLCFVGKAFVISFCDAVLKECGRRIETWMSEKSMLEKTGLMKLKRRKYKEWQLVYTRTIS